MKWLIALVVTVSICLITSHALTCEPGDVCSPECRDAQISVQEAVLEGVPYRNHGQLMKKVNRLVRKERKAGNINGRCGACIKKQFAHKIPPEHQKPCGMNAISQEILAFATDEFERIRDIIDPSDDTKPKAKFIGEHIEVKSKRWVYVLDSNGYQLFRPKRMFPHLRKIFSSDISPYLDEWKGQPVPENIITEAKRIAFLTLGVNYQRDTMVDVYPARELIALKSIDSEISHHEGRTMVNFKRVGRDDDMILSYYAAIAHTADGYMRGKSTPAVRPRGSSETTVTFAPGGDVIRVETALAADEVRRVITIYREALYNRLIKPRRYQGDFDLHFGSFYGPDEWRFGYTAHSFAGEDFITDNEPWCGFLNPDYRFPYNAECNPHYEDFFWYIPGCFDDPDTDFEYYKNMPHYRNDFWICWNETGRKNGIRGNCLDYDDATNTCLKWENDYVIVHHHNMNEYNYVPICDDSINFYPPVPGSGEPSCEPGIGHFENCTGDWPEHPYAVGYKMDEQFYADLEQNHVAVIGTHGGMMACSDYLQFKKQKEIWVSLHREDDDGLGNGNLRHLFLAMCSSMNWNHGPKHGEPQNLFTDWMNDHVADGIRTICGADGGSAGMHYTGLRFFKYYHLGDSITQAWFMTEYEKCPCNVPVVVAYGGSPEEAASTLFDGRFSKSRAGTGYAIAAELETYHLVGHQACCVEGWGCFDAPPEECQDPAWVYWYTNGAVEGTPGNPNGSNSQCGDHCHDYGGYIGYFDYLTCIGSDL